MIQIYFVSEENVLFMSDNAPLKTLFHVTSHYLSQADVVIFIVLLFSVIWKKYWKSIR